MSVSGQPPLTPPPPQIDQTRELLQFLREENEANRRATREDGEASRGLLRFTVWLVALPITALIVVVGWFGFKTVSDLKATLQNQAKQSTEAEITRMRVDIHNRLDAQFQTPELQKMVNSTAADYTKKAAEPLIKSEVAAQVKLRVDAERPAIAKAVSQQTNEAVKHMEPQIRTTVEDSVESEVKSSVAPLKASVADLTTQVAPLSQTLNQLKADANVEHLITRMKSDDASAFDQLMTLLTVTTNSEERGLLNQALGDVVEEHEQTLRMARQFRNPHTEEQMRAELSNPDPMMRLTAIDLLGDKLELSRIVELATSDTSINVRCDAGHIFDTRTKQQFTCLASPYIRAWWEANKQTFPDKK